VVGQSALKLQIDTLKNAIFAIPEVKELQKEIESLLRKYNQNIDSIYSLFCKSNEVIHFWYSFISSSFLIHGLAIPQLALIFVVLARL
jgi:5,10-methylenetetrahydrofolate reductase